MQTYPGLRESAGVIKPLPGLALHRTKLNFSSSPPSLPLPPPPNHTKLTGFFFLITVAPKLGIFFVTIQAFANQTCIFLRVLSTLITLLY